MFRHIPTKRIFQRLFAGSFSSTIKQYKKPMILASSLSAGFLLTSTTTEKNPTTLNQLKHDTGLQNYLKNIYITCGVGLLGTIGTSYVFAPLMKTTTAMYISMGLGFVSSLIFGEIVNHIKSKKVEKIIDGVSEYDVIQPTKRLLAFGGLVVSTGLLISPLTAMVIAISPSLMITATLATLGTVAGASLYTYTRKDDQLTAWGPILYSGLLGLICLNGGLLALKLLKPASNFGAMWLTAEPYIGIGLFSGLMAYDTHVAIQQYKTGNKDYLDAAVKIYMSSVNVLIRFMEILLKEHEKTRK